MIIFFLVITSGEEYQSSPINNIVLHFNILYEVSKKDIIYLTGFSEVDKSSKNRCK